MSIIREDFHIHVLTYSTTLEDVAPEMDWGVIEIIPEDPGLPGILADVATIIADNNISIRQAIFDDFELSEEPRLFIVTEKQIPGSLIPEIRKAKGRKSLAYLLKHIIIIFLQYSLYHF